MPIAYCERGNFVLQVEVVIVFGNLATSTCETEQSEVNGFCIALVSIRIDVGAYKIQW